MSGDIITTPSSANSVVTTATVQDGEQKNVIAPVNSTASGVIQNVIGQGHSAEISQEDGLAQNIIITEVHGGDQQVGHDLGSAVLTIAITLVFCC